MSDRDTIHRQFVAYWHQCTEAEKLYLRKRVEYWTPFRKVLWVNTLEYDALSWGGAKLAVLGISESEILVQVTWTEFNFMVKHLIAYGGK